jgi:DNA-binding Lrp family transcriptional regulator
MNRYSKEVEELMKTFYNRLNEKDKRGYAAAEAYKLGWGGQEYICEILGCCPRVIKRGLEELQSGEEYSTIRLAGGGAKRIIENDNELSDIFWEIVLNHTAGDPMNEKIKWTDLSVVEIIEQYKIRGYDVSKYIVKQMLKKFNFVKRKAKKDEELKRVPNRNEQFENIEELKEEYRKTGDPIISVDVKKKEKIGNFYRDGKLYCTEAVIVLDHDFTSGSDGVIIPHGIYDIDRNEAYITIGTSKDTTAVNLRTRWRFAQ